MQNLGGGGQIDLTVRVAVTGHRKLSEIDALTEALDRAIHDLITAVPAGDSTNTALKIVVISALAEGADRLVAKRLLKDGGTLDAVLPLDADEYEKDFESADSRAEYRALLAQARVTTVAPPADSRREAYLLAGRAIAERADVLIALWDGQPAHGRGGTGDIVQYARDIRVPMIWISTDGRHRVVPEIAGAPVDWKDLSPLSREAVAHLDRYNGTLHRPNRFGAAVAKKRSSLRSTISSDSDLPVEETLDWIAPRFVRAELQASYFQWWYKGLGAALFFIAFLAVTTVATQILYQPTRPAIVWIEVGLLILAGAGFFLGRRLKLHERWITARYLSEALRSAVFLALAGIGDDVKRDAARLPEGDPIDAWLQRAFSEVWRERPRHQPTESAVGPLQRILADEWIEDQVGYHCGAAESNGRKHELFTLFTGGLFVVSILAAVLHSLRVLHHGEHEFTLWAFLSIVVPALGSAISGLVAQREYQQHCQRSKRMVRRLREFKVQMEAAPDLATVQSLTLEIERSMREESGEWFGVVRLHDLELTT